MLRDDRPSPSQISISSDSVTHRREIRPVSSFSDQTVEAVGLRGVQKERILQAARVRLEALEPETRERCLQRVRARLMDAADDTYVFFAARSYSHRSEAGRVGVPRYPR